MRIAFIDHKLNLKNGGGSNITLHHMACALTDLGHDVTVVTVSPARNSLRDDAPYRVVEQPLSERSLDVRGKSAFVAMLRQMEEDVDVFQIEAPSLILPAAMYRARGGRKPVVARLNNYGFFCTNVSMMNAECYRHCTLLKRIQHRDEHPLHKVLLSPLRLSVQLASNLLVNKVDRFIALSPAVAEIHSWYGMNPDKMVIISPPLDPELSRLPARPTPAMRQSDEPFRMLYTGRLAMEKGVDTLLQAVAALEFPFSLDIVGAGDAHERFQRMAVDLGIASNVNFRGWVSQEEIVEYYMTADLFVHPGRWPEPAGRTVLEAMAIGVPIIVSDVGGPPWIAQDGALTFAPGDAEDLSQAIRRVFHDPTLANRLTTSAKARARQFDRARVAQQLVDLYDDVCSSEVPIRSATQVMTR